MSAKFSVCVCVLHFAARPVDALSTNRRPVIELELEHTRIVLLTSGGSSRYVKNMEIQIKFYPQPRERAPESESAIQILYPSLYSLKHLPSGRVNLSKSLVVGCSHYKLFVINF